MNIGMFQATPIQRISENLNNNTFFIKRDDLLPLSFGGNKARKAVLFFEDLMREESDCVVTYGSSSSNHCRIIANIAAVKNIPCHIISPSESNHPTSNSKMIELFGALVTLCPLAEVSITIERKLVELKEQGYKPYFIQGGGHGDIGTQAYVSAYEEILDYERASGMKFDYIFHTTGTGTTQAGLVCGKLLHGDKREIVGISNSRKNPYGGQVVLDSVNSYFTNIGKVPITTEEITFIDDYVLSGYGCYNQQILKTIKEVLINDGIPMDPTYTGKGFWGMKEYIKNNQIYGNKVLFIHTGGTPLFFDNLEELMNE
ncbi:1-aminocyclopropane-1-carboxylate deaminase/D-cysteine desulfhydrase [Peribacillus frigoritolerans]|uniref:1-aminocyclopropane-1-carboxylate deaminase/D-cysteine desulfhydrase n=1 Tax=Peribacillus frigoritolerans TaxID=450367 RepID=UPI002231488D|nr:pyridoxal-phosphate dependent enzyme [Peribacillus frigoritolerans]UZD45490.1 pyridoxal-phosphate dependent enzyme [Peribacillus frigoritolerans]